MEKRGVFIIPLVVSLLLVLSFIGLFLDEATITGMQVGGLGCCVYADGCEASDIGSCAGDFFDTPCEDVPQCQKGCCICTDNEGYAVAAFADVTLTECSIEDPGVCYGIADIAASTFNAETSAEDCTIAAYSPGNITGYITDKETRQGIVGALVKATPSNIEATTQAYGSYELNNIAPGTVEITVSHPNYYTNTSLTSLGPEEKKVNYDIALSKVLVTTGTIQGKISVTGSGASPEDITVLLEPTYDSTKTDSSGDYSFSNLKFNTYTVVASKSGYSQNSTDVTIDEDNPSASVDLIIKKLTLGTITGRVIAEEGSFEEARIYVDGALKYLTNSGGYYSIQVETGPHHMYAVAEGYNKDNQEINVVEGTNTQDFSLYPLSPECSYPNSPSPDWVTISHISGTKAVKISWDSACDDLAGYQLNRTGTSEKSKYFTVLDGEQTLSYIDSDVEWGKTYTYSITAIYDDMEIRYSTPRYSSSSITLGDERCEGRYLYSEQKFSEFCDDTYYRITCDEENQIINAPERGTDPRIPQDCSTLNQQGVHYICSGPDSQGLTHCKDLEACNVISQEADPFGLYFTKDDCYGTSTSPNYCYFDYSDTVADTCYPCSQEMTCFDYMSDEPACMDDNCQVSGIDDCGWYDTYPELGKGVCFEQGYNGTEYCSRCDADNDLFWNSGCTQELCDVLGDCYANDDETSCLACIDCESLSSEQQCTGGIGFAINPSPQCSQSFTLSQDSCGLGKCKWDAVNEVCYKDANDRDGADCLLEDEDCRRDFIAPSTEPEQGVLIVTNTSGITFFSDSDSYDGFLHYCVDTTNECCPANTKKYTDISQKGKIDLTSEDLLESYPDMYDGQYYLRYYSTDVHHNQELVKETIFTADLKPPKITITLFIQKGDCQTDSTLFFNISTDDYAECSDSLKQTRGPSCNEDCPSWSSLSGSKGISWETSYTAEDGEYTYSVTCTDNNGNTAIEEKEIEIDACWLIDIVHPDEAIKEIDPIFEVTTTNPSTCGLYFDDVWQKDFTTTEGLSHTAAILNPLEKNNTYLNFKAQCTNLRNISQIDIEGFAFTTDYAAPTTELDFYKEGFDLSTNNSDWHIWLSEQEPFTLSLVCHDEYSSMQHSFGCESGSTKWCSSDSSTQDCTPAIAYSGQISSDADQTTRFCYSSKDLGENQEDAKCGTVHIGEGVGIYLVEPSYGVSNKDIFDVEIDATIPTNLCKFQANGFPNPFSSQNNPANFFTPMDTTPTPDHHIVDFDQAVPSYDMYVKCQDLNGFVNEDQPANFMIEYDPTSPLIQEAYADPNPVTQGETVDLLVKTDDKTICKFSNWTTDYYSMNQKFDGWEEFGTLLFRDGVEPEFKYTNTVTVPLAPTTESTEYSYHIACQNRAGNISETRTINFIVDYSISGYISYTAPSGSIRETTIDLEVNTSKNANCQYEEESFPYYFDLTGGKYHTSQKSGLIEGRHQYPITCYFFSPAVTRTSTIDFRVDLTNPVINSIDDGNYSCGDDVLLQIDAEDESDVYFNYSLYEKSTGDMILNWTYTTSSNPSVDLPDEIEENKTYFFKVIPIDSAGNIGAEKQSDGFIAKDANSDECINDNDPPEIFLKKEPTHSGIKITIICSDATGCDYLLYNEVPPESTCSPTKTYANPFTITQTSKICWEASDVMDNLATGYEIVVINDEDGDGVPDEFDECPDTPPGSVVDDDGCSTSQKDSDGDGLPDYWENQYDLDPYDPYGDNGRDGDPDNDGITNYEEYLAGTDPTVANIKDSDNDGMPDDWENKYGLDPYDSSDAVLDPDNDGLTNLEEYLRGTDPNNPDSDGDGISDGGERTSGTDPNNPFDTPVDDDNDGIDDNWEDQNCGGDCDPDADSDGDGASNLMEYYWNLDPNNADSDNDGMPDGWEISNGTIANKEDGNEDYDNDGLTNLEEYLNGTDPHNSDSDGDGMSDGWEIRQGLDPKDSSDAYSDPDDDELTNIEEFEYYQSTGRFIDINKKDTDGDGWSDKAEIDAGYNPADAASHPVSKTIAFMFMFFGILFMLSGGVYLAYKEKTTEKKPKQQVQPQKITPIRRVSPSISSMRRRQKIKAEELKEKKEEILEKRKEAKSKKRSRFFEAFSPGKSLKKPGSKKKRLVLGKVLGKKELKKIAKEVKIPESRSEFEKLALLTEKHLKGEESIDKLLKLTKVSKEKEDEFEKLKELIEGRIKIPKEKRIKELSPQQKQEIRDIFYELSEMSEKRSSSSSKDTFEELKSLRKTRSKEKIKKGNQKKQALKKTPKLNSGSKPKKQVFEKLKDLNDSSKKISKKIKKQK